MGRGLSAGVAMKAWGALLVALTLVLPAAAQQGIDQAQVKALFASARFSELEAVYAPLVPARTRNRWGEFHSEEFFRSLDARGSAHTDEAWAIFDNLTSRWLEHSPAAPAAAIAKALGLIERASDLDIKHSWTDIDGLVQRAQESLERVRATSVKDPTWHAAMLDVARMQGGNEARLRAEVFAAVGGESWALSPYLAAAHAFSLDRPQSLGLLAELAALAVRHTKRGDGQSMYARVYLGAVPWYPAIRANPFGAGHMDWAKLNPAMSDLHTHFPQQHLLNQHAALACLAGDRATASTLIERIGTSPIRASWDYWGGVPLYDNCREWVNRQPEAIGPRKIASTH